MAVKITMKVEPVVGYTFGGSETQGNASMKEVLGGKGANLAEMASIGVPVPAGFTIPCSASVRYKGYKDNGPAMGAFLNSLWVSVFKGLKFIQQVEGELALVSVRSGSRVSMPGMMDTILNVGITSANLDAHIEKMGARTTYDSYRRLIQMYSSVALGVPMDKFEAILTEERVAAGVATDAELSARVLSQVVTRYLALLESLNVEFPDTFEEQLQGAILSVFRSWDNPRAVEYRKINGIPEEWGTAVNVQAMVFGNLNDKSATGVLFTRDPATGQNQVVGEYLVNAQGEDVVAGIRTPLPLSDMASWNPEILDSLVETVSTLENHYKDMQDVEFTIQDGKLYILQTRNGKRSAASAFRIAYDLAEEGLITKDEAVGRVNQKQLLAMMQNSLDPKFNMAPHLVGTAAGGGLVTGVAVFTSERAVNCTEPCILVRSETDPEDIAGMNAAVGILTSTGGITSHAAVVARGMNKSCVVGATALTIGDSDPAMTQAVISPSGPAFKEGTKITLDGATGNVWVGVDVPVIAGGSSPEVRSIIGWGMQKHGSVSERLDFNTFSPADIDAAVAEATSSSIYIDTALFEPVPGQDLGPMVSRIKVLGFALAASTKVTEVILDMTPLAHLLPAPDVVFYSMFGLSEDNATVPAIIVNALKSWPKAVTAMTSVRSFMPLDKGLCDALKSYGFSLHSHIRTVADLLEAKGPVQITPGVISSVFGGEDAYKKMCSMVEVATGNSIGGKIPRPVYWYDFFSEAA